MRKVTTSTTRAGGAIMPSYSGNVFSRTLSTTSTNSIFCSRVSRTFRGIHVSRVRALSTATVPGSLSPVNSMAPCVIVRGTSKHLQNRLASARGLRYYSDQQQQQQPQQQTAPAYSAEQPPQPVQQAQTEQQATPQQQAQPAPPKADPASAEQAIRVELAKNKTWYYENAESLLENYKQKWIAISKQKVAASNADYKGLKPFLAQLPKSTFVVKVGEEDTPIPVETAAPPTQSTDKPQAN